MNRINCFSIALALCATACVTEEAGLEDDELGEVEQEVALAYTPRHLDRLVITMLNDADYVPRSLDAPWYGRDAIAGDPVNQFKSHEQLNQQWDLLSTGQSSNLNGVTYPVFRLRNVWSGLCMEFFERGIKQQSCTDPNRVNSQKFFFTKVGTEVLLRMVVSDWLTYCVDVPNGAAQDGLQVQRYGCNGAPNQRWALKKCDASGCTRVVL